MGEILPYLVYLTGGCLLIGINPGAYHLPILSEPFPLGCNNRYSNLQRLDELLKSLAGSGLLGKFAADFGFVSASVSSQLILGFAMALLINRPHIKGIGVVRTLIILPMSITPIVVGLMWRILYNPSFGLINAFLGLLGIVGPEWLGSKDTALLSVILVDIWQWTPFMFLMMTAGLQSLPAEPFEAALVDGASGFQILRLITLPLMKPIILVAVLFRIIDGFKVSTFDSIFIMTKGGPGSITQTLNIYAFLTGFEWFNLGYASAMVVFTLVLLTIIGRLFLRMGVFREEME